MKNTHFQNTLINICSNKKKNKYTKCGGNLMMQTESQLCYLKAHNKHKKKEKEKKKTNLSDNSL